LNRYRDLNSYLREIFGERVHKIALDAGLGCPNRDGTISSHGCTFCNWLGSGTGQLIKNGFSIDQQIYQAREFIRKRYHARKFIAYFQSFSNTYAPLHKLKDIYAQALAHDDMVGLSVATRPDCVNSDVLDLISSYKQDYLVWIEYGLQSAHNITLMRINRGHDVACFEKSVIMADKFGLNICVHVILGLPGEDCKMMLQTARFLSTLPIHGIKIHLLYVVKNTPLATSFQKGEIRCLEREEYVDLVVRFLEILPPEIIIHRLTGDPTKSDLIAPLWANEKSANLKLIRETLKKRHTWQGKYYRKSTAGN